MLHGKKEKTDFKRPLHTPVGTGGDNTQRENLETI